MFGRRTVAAAHAFPAGTFPGQGPAPRGRPALVLVKGGLPASRQGRVGFSPPRRGVSVGADCVPQAVLQNGNPPNAPWCTNMQDAGPIPMGSGIASIDPANGNVLGTGSVALTPTEGFTLASITITTQEPLLLVTGITVGRYSFMESGQVAADLWQSGSETCKLLRGTNIFPSVGITFTFGNPSNTTAKVIVSLLGWPQSCPQGRTGA